MEGRRKVKRSFAVAWAQGCFAELPFLEIYRSFFHSKLQILGLAAEEAILLLMSLSVLAAGALYALKRKQKKAVLH